MSKFDELTRAIKQLKMYGNVASLDDFYLKALQMSDVSEEGDDLKLDEKAFEVITGLTDGGLFLSEILAKINEASEGGGDTEAIKNAFHVIGTNGAGTDTTGILSSITMNDMLLTQLGSAASRPSAPSKNQPGLCCIQVLPAMLNFGQRDTGAVEIFMNMIPTTEWSRAIPYLDVEVITPGPAVTTNSDGNKKNAGISQLRFLNGVSTISAGADTIISEAKSAAVAAAGQEAADSAAAQNTAANEAAAQAGQPNPEQAVPAQYSSAGMEIFTSPQTLIPAWEQYASYDEVAAFEEASLQTRGGDIPWPGQPGSSRAAPILDRMRPFMTLTDISISIKPTRGMMSHKSAEIKLMLHDRSRLGEIGAFVKPSSFGQTELLIEYGWSHPDAPENNGNERNPFGLFINSLRVKEKFAVYNSKYSFKDDGQVEISLSCVTKGASSVNITDIGLSPEATTKFAALEALIEAISILRRDVSGTPGMADVTGMSTISNLSPTNAGAMFNGDDYDDIQAFITTYGGSGGDTGALADTLSAAVDATTEVQATIAGTVSTKIRIAKKTGDPFLKPRGKSKTDTTSKIANHPSRPRDTSSWCSFGRLAALFIGAPLMESKRFNEVQMIFYTFNDKSSFMFNQNIACFPIEMDNASTSFPKLFDTWQKEKVQVSVASFMGFVNRYFLSNMACKAYGFSSLFTRDEDGKAVIKDERESARRQLNSKKDDVLEKAYGDSGDPTFKLPRIRMMPECVPHRKTGAEDTDAFGPQDTILRLHFFDDSASKYAGLHDILGSARDNEMGAVRTSVSEVDEDTSVNDANWAALQADLVQGVTSTGIIEQIPGTDFFRVIGGAPALKHYIKSSMPSITYGSQNCSLTNLTVGSMHNSADTTIHMLRAQREGTSDSGTPGEQDRGLPLRMMPMQASGESFGCPLLNHGQQFFIDMGTGTTVDNVYAVSGLDHSISPGKFTTKFKLIPIDAFGKYESMVSQVSKAQAIITANT